MTEVPLSVDGQPINRVFNHSRNCAKAVFGLRGILQGVVADKKLNSQEVLFLDTWLRSQRHLDEGDVVDLLDLIGDALRDGVITSAEMTEINQLIADVIEYGTKDSDDFNDLISELLGILQGIAADNKLMLSEFDYLDKWIVANPEISKLWPADVLIDRINAIKADGVVDEHELSDLLQVSKQMTGLRLEETGEACGGVAEVFADEIESYDFNGARVCFTGKFVCGTRRAVQSATEARGAVISKKIVRALDVLIVGTIASRDWRFASHGKKIETALKWNNDGSKILILSERGWQKLM